MWTRAAGTDDEQRITFRRNGLNLYQLDLRTGGLSQLTDFPTGTKRTEPKLTDEEKYLKTEQLRLFDILRECEARRDEADRIRRTDRPRRPEETYQDDRQLLNPLLSPDGRFVTYRLTKADPSSGRVAGAQTMLGLCDVPAYRRTAAGQTDTSRQSNPARPVVINGPVWSEDGAQCVVVVRSLDNKDRWICRLDLATLAFVHGAGYLQNAHRW